MDIKKKIRKNIPEKVDHAFCVYLSDDGTMTAGTHGDLMSICAGLLSLVKKDELARTLILSVIEAYNLEMAKDENQDTKGAV